MAAARKSLRELVRLAQKQGGKSVLEICEG
jgi:hypothetical protein